MERKTTQRVIGILVVAALVVISLPLLFGGNSNDDLAQTAELKAPPFPDQTGIDTTIISQNTADTINPYPSKVTIENGTTTVADAGNSESIQATPSPLVSTDLAAPMITASKSETVKNDVIKNETPSNKLAINQANTINESNVAAANVQDISTETTSSNNNYKKNKRYKNVKLVQAKNAITSGNNAAWAVQMGSFKNKSNALRLANQLRAQGYKAFTQNRGSNTKVFVGPEVKHASASSLAGQIQQKMNVQGFVVSYHPLEI